MARPLNRPLSPLMFPVCFRFQITSALSILHRLTGIGLAVGSILLVWWLFCVAAGGEYFDVTLALLTSPIGMLLLFLWSIAWIASRIRSVSIAATIMNCTKTCSKGLNPAKAIGHTKEMMGERG